MQNHDNVYERWTILGYQVVGQNSSKDTLSVDVIELVRKNYIAMPEVYWNADLSDSNSYYYYTLIGHKDGGQKDTLNSPLFVGDQIPFGLGYCTYYCEGNTYAYNIEIVDNIGTDVVYLTDYAKPLSNGLFSTRSYEYMSETFFLNNIQQAPTGYWFNYYNLSIPYQQGAVNILSNSGGNIQFKDRDGLLITSNTVYAVDKTMGKWRGQNINYNILNATTLCGLGQTAILDHFNLNFDFQSLNEQHSNLPVPDLYCSKWTNPFEIQGVNTDLVDSWNDCIINFIDPQVNTAPNSFIAWISGVRECFNETFLDMSFFDSDDIVVNYASVWPENVAKILLIHTDNAIDPIELDYADMLNSNNVFVGKSFTTPAGLYEVKLFGENAEVITLLVELKDNIVNQFKMKDFLQVNLFPNPITQNTYNLDLTASSDISFEYKMYDSNSNLREQKNYIMKAGSRINEAFSPMVSEYPAGIMVHQFLFTDGSVKTVTGLKVNP